MLCPCQPFSLEFGALQLILLRLRLIIAMILRPLRSRVMESRESSRSSKADIDPDLGRKSNIRNHQRMSQRKTAFRLPQRFSHRFTLQATQSQRELLRTLEGLHLDAAAERLGDHAGQLVRVEAQVCHLDAVE